MKQLGPQQRPIHMIMERAYEGDETCQLALDLGDDPVVPLKSRSPDNGADNTVRVP